jgi:hypothetical protein
VTTLGPKVTDSPAAEPPIVAPNHSSPHRSADTPGSASTHRWRTLLFAAGAYLLLSLIVWWNVWSSNPTSTTTCGCGDSSLFTWFIEWPAYAISHGLNPFYSTAMFYPGGVNLLANTSEVAIGVFLAPVTWIFGPIATLNVALTLSPVLSALAMFILLRRWVSWAPAAFIGGLFYGFSPFIFEYLIDGHLMLGMAVVPPLVVACLDELLFRQRRRPVVTGIVLGLLVTLQFFIGTEVLFITAIAGVTGIVLVGAYATLRHPETVRDHARYAIVGLSAGAITAAVLVAYPAWFALAGPAHYSGEVWPNLELAFAGNKLQSLVDPWIKVPVLGALGLAKRAGGPQGPRLSTDYFGMGVLTVLAGGCLAWRRDRRLWLFGAITLVSLALSMGVVKDYFAPWQLLAKLPLFENVTPSRFVLIAFLAVAVMLGLIVEHTYLAVSRRSKVARDRTGGLWSQPPAWAASAAAFTVAAIALIPVAAYLAVGTPMTTEPVVLPSWFRTVAPHLEGHQVLLVFPVPFSYIQSAMTWQAVDRMHYSMVGGGGPGSLAVRAGKEREGLTIIGNASFSLTPQNIQPGDISATRHALDGWGVTMVVIPDQAKLPAYDKVTSVPFAVALITAATGQRPIHQADAWVWTSVEHAGPPVVPSPSDFSDCTRSAAAERASSIEGVASCVLATSFRDH